LLMKALEKAGQHYTVAVVQKLTDLQIPDIISYTDRDAILVRSNRPLNVVGREIHIYDNLLAIPFMGEPIQILRGWIAVDVKFRGTKFKFVNTHLEAPLPVELDPDRETKLLQYVQALQLVDELSTTSLPIILAGDFNSDAEPTPGYEPDKTLSYGSLIASGYTDPWHAFHDLDDYGYTWPFVTGTDSFERIDLILTNGPVALSTERIGATPVGGLFASDHAGVVAEFQLSNPR
jgi:endonuclease/exonuclease/phosphatase family metal-dependent hydrolase